MISTNRHNLVVAVEDEPFPRGPSGESSRLKLKDWLERAKLLERTVQIEVIAPGELGNRKPDVVEAFATRDHLLTSATFPTRKEHEKVSRFSNYWPSVEKSEVPAVGVIRGAPHKSPFLFAASRAHLPGAV